MQIVYAACSWLVPGLGHILRGERLKGVILMVALLSCFLAGEIMSQGHAVSRTEHPIAYWAQVGAGGPTLLSAWYDEKWNRPQLGSDPHPVPRLLDCGIMYTCVAGLLSFVVVVDLLCPRGGGRDHD